MSLLNMMIVLALFATAATLATGVVSMVRGGDYDREHGTELMFKRVALQGITLVFLLVAFVLA